MDRELNWFGWSIDTIAAVYETDQAVRESESGQSGLDYVWAAHRAEEMQHSLDRDQTEER